MKRALICGVSGQDGAYLSRFLLGKGYQVFGTTRHLAGRSFPSLEALEVDQDVSVLEMPLTDVGAITSVLQDVAPDEIYNLSAQSSVGLSFSRPVDTFEGIVMGTISLLEAARLSGSTARMFFAGSGECFGETPVPATEHTPFSPCSPYAVAKASSFWAVENYASVYGLPAATGILFNHESPLRSSHFVSGKVVSAAVRIASGSPERLSLGNMSVERDWGWAPEFVEAMWLMLQQPSPQSMVIATGRSFPLERFVQAVFEACGLDYHDHVDMDPSLLRPSDVRVSLADPSLIFDKCGWRAASDMPLVAARLVECHSNLVPL